MTLFKYITPKIYRNRILLLLMVSCQLVWGCTKDNHEKQDPIQDNTNILGNNTKENTSKNISDNKKTDSSLLSKKKISTDSSDKKNNAAESSTQKLTAQQKLLKSIPKGMKIDFAPLDLYIQEEDTVIQTKSGKFEIKYRTQSLNDSLVAQELLDYGVTNAKSYLISHNYQTNIAMRKDGKLVGAKMINKEIFTGKIDKEFLEKSIIKHPEFVRFDEEKNEAIFKFMIGVPNTDWLVFAAINLSEKGKLRIIEILMPEL